MKHYVSPDREKRPDLAIAHTGTDGLKSVNSLEEIVNEIISLALSMKEKGYQFLGLFLEGKGSPKKLRMLPIVWKYNVKITM